MITFFSVLYAAGVIVSLGMLHRGVPGNSVWFNIPAAVLWPILVFWGIGEGFSKMVEGDRK